MKLRMTAALLVAGGALSASSLGTDLYWANPSGGNFGTTTNWTPTGSPSGNTVHFTYPSAYTVTFSSNVTCAAGWFDTGTVTFDLNGYTLQLGPTDGIPVGSYFVIGYDEDLTNPTLIITNGTVSSPNVAIHVDGGANIGGSVSTLIVSTGGIVDVLEDIVVGFSGGGSELAVLRVESTGQAFAGDEVRIGQFGGAGGWTGHAKVVGVNSLLSADDDILIGYNGLLELSGGGHVAAGDICKVNSGGHVKGKGDIAATTVENKLGGVIEPLVTTDRWSMSVTGNYDQSGGSAGKLLIGLATGGAFGNLEVSGSATLGGTLEVTVGSYSPAAGAKFKIVDAGSKTGSFATETLPTLTGCKEFKVVYSCTNDVWLLVKTQLSGDADFDGDVDMDDMNIAIAQFSQTGCLLAGDVNYDGVVDSADLNIIANNLSTSC